MTGRQLGVTVALAVCVSSGYAQTQQASIKDFVGKWVVTDIVDYSDISDGVPGAKRVLGEVMTITPKSIHFENQTCAPHDGLAVRDVDTQTELNAEYGLRTNETGLPPRTALLGGGNCFAVFKKSASMIVFGWKGVVVRAVPSK